jgi:hypothetical protein
MILNGPYIVSQSRKTSPPRIRSNAQPGEVGLLLLFVDILANFDLTSSPGPPSKAAGVGVQRVVGNRNCAGSGRRKICFGVKSVTLCIKSLISHDIAARQWHGSHLSPYFASEIKIHQKMSTKSSLRMRTNGMLPGGSNKPYPTTISSRSDFPKSMRPPKPNSVEPPWSGTRMPGGAGGVASQGVPLSRSWAVTAHSRADDGPGCISRRQRKRKICGPRVRCPNDPIPAADWRSVHCHRRHVLVRSSGWPSHVFPGVQGGLPSHQGQVRDRFAHHSGHPVRRTAGGCFGAVRHAGSV